MCCKVKKAFGCYTLEGFGLFDAGMSIILCALVIFISVWALLKPFDAEQFCKSSTNIAISLFALKHCKQFIFGIKQVVSGLVRHLQKIMTNQTFQRDEDKMIIYLVLKFLVTCLALTFLLFILVVFVMYGNIRSSEEKIIVVVSLLIFGFQYYSFVCVISLFLGPTENLIIPFSYASNENGVLVNPTMWIHKTQQRQIHGWLPPPLYRTLSYLIAKIFQCRSKLRQDLRKSDNNCVPKVKKTIYRGKSGNIFCLKKKLQFLSL